MNDSYPHNWWYNILRHVKDPPLFSPMEAILTGLIVLCGCWLAASLIFRMLAK